MMVLAFIRQWWHCLMGTFGYHCMTYDYVNNKLLTIGCECGKVFWTGNAEMSAAVRQMVEDAKRCERRRERRGPCI